MWIVYLLEIKLLLLLLLSAKVNNQPFHVIKCTHFLCTDLTMSYLWTIMTHILLLRWSIILITFVSKNLEHPSIFIPLYNQPQDFIKRQLGRPAEDRCVYLRQMMTHIAGWDQYGECAIFGQNALVLCNCAYCLTRTTHISTKSVWWAQQVNLKYFSGINQTKDVVIYYSKHGQNWPYFPFRVRNMCNECYGKCLNFIFSSQI